MPRQSQNSPHLPPKETRGRVIGTSRTNRRGFLAAAWRRSPRHPCHGRPRQARRGFQSLFSMDALPVFLTCFPHCGPSGPSFSDTNPAVVGWRAEAKWLSGTGNREKGLVRPFSPALPRPQALTHTHPYTAACLVCLPEPCQTDGREVLTTGSQLVAG